MHNDQVTELLKNYRSYRYAAKNTMEYVDETGIIMSRVYAERLPNRNVWDATRYNRIVNMINGAVDEVLSDDQRTVIKRKYLDRNPQNINEISYSIHKDRCTVSRWHKDAIRRLAIALEPLSYDEREIQNIDHIFDPNWKFDMVG